MGTATLKRRILISREKELVEKIRSKAKKIRPRLKTMSELELFCWRIMDFICIVDCGRALMLPVNPILQGR